MRVMSEEASESESGIGKDEMTEMKGSTGGY